MGDSLPLHGGPYHFFPRSSRSAAASSIDSARSFFSFAFSSSIAFSRLVSETSIPPYRDFQLYSVASDIPCLRHRSTSFADIKYYAALILEYRIKYYVPLIMSP